MTQSLFQAIIGEDSEPVGSTKENSLWQWSDPARPSTASRPTEELPAYKTKRSGAECMDQIINRASRTYHVEPALIKAVIKAESNFDPDATSPKGAMGLMQLMPETARDLGVKDPYDPTENIMAGTRYLGMLLDRYEGNIPLALAGYNWGMGNVERHPGGLPQETRTYIARVNQYYRETTT
jgi:soluble lytic murein transglycosylase-like protein